MVGRYYASDFSWPVDPQGYHYGAAYIRLRPQDLAVFALTYLHNGQWNGDQVVPASWVQESTTAQVEINGDLGDYGYLWWVTEIDGDPAFLAFGHPGTVVTVMPERDLVVVIVAEIDDRDPETWDVAIDGAAAVEILSTVIAPPFR